MPQRTKQRKEKGKTPKKSKGPAMLERQKMGGVASKPKRAGRPAGRVQKSKPVNTPGEGQRGFEGMVNHMVSMSQSQFNKMIKNIRAKRR